MKHVMSILGTLAIILLWFLPIITIRSIPEHIGSAGALIYLPIFLLTLGWGLLLNSKY